MTNNLVTPKASNFESQSNNDDDAVITKIYDLTKDIHAEKQLKA